MTTPISKAPDRHSNLDKPSLKEEVSHLLLECGTEGWDGEGALPVSAETVSVALKLVDSFPSYLPNPEVFATPQGEVDFDWVPSREVMLTVSVGASQSIAFAGLFNGARLNGSEPWDDVLPHFVQCCFERLRLSTS